MDQKPNLPEQINLMPVIQWLEAGCDPKHAAAELRIYAERLAAAALSAPPAQEPVAWMTNESKHRLAAGGNCKGAVPVHGKPSSTAKIPLYASPLPQEPQEGKALTDERINELAAEYGDALDQAFIFNRLGQFSAVAFARAVERELRGAQEGKAGEVDAEAAIAYGFKRWGYKQGTKECIAFYRGACWQILSATSREGEQR